LEAGQALDQLPRPAVHGKKGTLQRLRERALSDEGWALEYVDETWFVWVPPEGIMNPPVGYGWAPRGAPLRNLTSRKKGQVTWSTYLSLDAKEQRLSWRITQHTNRFETALFINERLRAHERRGHRVLVLVWDQASWHVAKDLWRWFRNHNRRVDRQGHGTKIVPMCTPVHAFWLNPVEPLIGDAKRRVLPCRQFASQTEQQAALDRHWLHRNLRHAAAPTPETLIAHLH
jgi:hypothetical protein